MSETVEPVEEFTKVESIFVRHKNALLLRAQLTPIYTDYYLHLMEHKVKPSQKLDEMLKDTLGFFILHMVARPWAETIAWTANLRAPRVNMFVTGSSIEENIVGRSFTEDVREPDRNYFYSQTVVKGKEPRQSTIEVDSTDPKEWVESFYLQSEQRPCKAFRLPEEHYALVVAQPDCDMEWFSNLDEKTAVKIPETEETKVLETRKFKFFCGCNQERIIATLGAWKDKPDELFEGAEHIQITCPRCAAGYLITKDMI